jgi:phytanoyl-CoA hydroxylase
MLTEAHQQFYNENGYVVVESLFSRDEVAALIDHFMELRRSPQQGDDIGINVDSADPLKRYPRIIHPHKWDEASRRFMFDARVRACLNGLLGADPIAVQTMVYFKPPGARGQALHQDNYYLRVQPGTCMAAWMALDPCDEANGCIEVVPGSHTWDMLCTEMADTNISFTDVTVPLPPGAQARPLPMQPGDVLFFNGSIVHGSQPNKTPDRFRRSLIAHYIEGDSVMVSKSYQPAYRMDGSLVEIEHGAGGDTCGVWVEQGGQPVLAQAPQPPVTHRAHTPISPH